MSRSRGARWTAADVPDQGGRTAIVTGANTGLGFETARMLAERGATVVLACRDVAKGDQAAERIRATAPGAELPVLELDLASLDSVRHASEQLQATRIDLLINNAGVMAPKTRVTADGQDLQLVTNHLGPFAFTGLLLERLLGVPGSRVVTVSSVLHRRGRIRDPQSVPASRWAGYARSKLANLLFTYELQRRLAAAGAETTALAAHPGSAFTDLARHLPGWIGRLDNPGLRWATRWFFQSAEMGALPTLRAATDPQAGGGDYYGPGGPRQLTGYPVPVEPAARARGTAAQHRLWEQSERLTGVTYPLTGNS